MCGVTGFIKPGQRLDDSAEGVARSMADRIVHRGPDDAGVWVDAQAGVALAHRRLSILELSESGHQPMFSSSGRYVIAFNGEIYNHLELRDGLAQVAWRGHSDTETLLAAFERWGIEATLRRTVGMFAIVLWDRVEHTLTLARDRVGEKPLYYGLQKGTLVFGSEIKSLQAHPDWIGEIDRGVLCLYLRHCYIPAPHSIYLGISKLLPGHYIQFPVAGGLDHWRSVEARAYWSMLDVVCKGMAQPFAGTDAEAVNALDVQLKQAIALQMVADVPLGAFLSGGVDSSTVVALMQAQSSRRVRTFSIGFDVESYNEAGHAKAVAGYLGTDHTEHYVTSQEAMEVIPRLGRMYDEPFADSSQIPTHLVSAIARRHVTVSLSGDAGDELFCGYNRYALADVWQKIEKVPFGARKAMGGFIKSISPAAWDRLVSHAGKMVSFPPNMGEKLEKLARRLETVDGVGALYYSLVSEVTAPERIVLDSREPGSWITEHGMKLRFSNAKQQMMFMDGMTYLPDDILVKVDRAAMAVSLETRVPFLDHRVIDLAWSLPLTMKMREGQTKWILRQVLYKYVPRELIERPKMGFGVPIGKWIRGPLRGWAESLLGEARLRQEGFFDVPFIRARWSEHLSGERNWQYFLWSVLMFELWLDEEKRGRAICSS